MSLHDDARFQEIYQDALRALEYLPHLESYPTERARIAERFTSEFLARHPECKPEPVDLQSGVSNASEVAIVSDGGREPEYAIMNGWLVEAEAGCTCYGGGPYGHEPGCGYAPVANIEKALEDAGYRNRPMPSVDEVATLLLDGHSDANGSDWGLDCAFGAEDARNAATAVLALFNGEES